MNITLLGTGSSSGVPMVGCDCAVCTSSNPKNKRKRVSALVEIDDKHILIDSSPDLHQQAIEHGIKRVDAVVYTHAHADHIHGIDDLRAFNIVNDAPLPIWVDADTHQALKSRFGYVFEDKPEPVWFRPCLEPQFIPTDPLTPFDVLGTQWQPILQTHGNQTSLGFRIGDFAYSTDMNEIPDESWQAFEGLDVWVVDCLRYTESWTHSTLERTLGWIEKLKPKRAILTHMAHQFDYDTLKNELPQGVEPGYDGMVISL